MDVVPDLLWSQLDLWTLIPTLVDIGKIMYLKQWIFLPSGVKNQNTLDLTLVSEDIPGDWIVYLHQPSNFILNEFLHSATTGDAFSWKLYLCYDVALHYFFIMNSKDSKLIRTPTTYCSDMLVLADYAPTFRLD